MLLMSFVWHVAEGPLPEPERQRIREFVDHSMELRCHCRTAAAVEVARGPDRRRYERISRIEGNEKYLRRLRRRRAVHRLSLRDRVRPQGSKEDFMCEGPSY